MDEENSGSYEGKKCCLADRCTTYNHPLSANDRPNVAAHLGFRVAYTFIAWMVLAKGINKESFFASIFLFVLPILMDCIKFTPQTKLRGYVKIGEVLITGAWSIFSILGILGILVVAVEDENFSIKTSSDFIGFTLADISVQHVWWYLASVMFVTMVDWLCNSTRLDSKLDKDLVPKEGV